VPGWEDSTLGNMYAGHVIEGDVKNVHTVRTGIEYMIELADYYTETTRDASIGFFQIGGGIAGDFPICVVPMLHQDLQRDDVPLWGYFCQISTRRPATAPTPAPCRTRRSPGASSASTRRST
jgi:deoxyhypusine synthase